jgi:hypothetical protein
MGFLKLGAIPLLGKSFPTSYRTQFSKNTHDTECDVEVISTAAEQKLPTSLYQVQLTWRDTEVPGPLGPGFPNTERYHSL